eukprot:TRINITY_DN35342_c0_g1_i1.p2 TRINITY_DN35342_c0_g1~~TRINITY_DN35342_c0_g1_i1.p2  ORF type:complete len:176 (+),score=11.48 TRINITY_DN35342_c0_g1_i1:138-665(+)
MENVPYRSKALKKKKKEEQVIVLEVSVPGWLPGIIMLALAGKCGHMIYRRLRNHNARKLKHGLDESDIRRHREFEEFKQLSSRYSYPPDYRNYNHNYKKQISPLDNRRAASLPTYKHNVDDTDSANEDSLSEYSRIPSPRERDHDSPLTPFEIYESCYEDFVGHRPRDSLDMDTW